MIKFRLHLEPTRWASLTLTAANRTIEICCTDDGDDCLGDLVRAFARLAAGGGKTEVHCYTEPGEVRVALRRSGADVHLTVKRFSWEGDGAPRKLWDRATRTGKKRDWEKMSRACDRRASLRYRGNFRKALKSFLDAYDAAVSEIGVENYGACWRHPYPAQAVDVIRSIAQEAEPQRFDRAHEH